VKESRTMARKTWRLVDAMLLFLLFLLPLMFIVGRGARLSARRFSSG
jgi:hypothetical protein